jgi:hypothetical protein
VAGQALALAAHVLPDLVDRVGGQIRQAAVLEVPPQHLHRIELGGVGRKPNDLPAGMGRQPGGDETVLVGEPAIPDEDDGTAHVAREMAEEPLHLRATDVHARAQGQGEGDLAAAGRHDQRRDAGHLVMRPGAHGQPRRDPAGGPCAAEDGHHHEAGLIQAHQVSALAREFFLPAACPSPEPRPPGLADCCESAEGSTGRGLVKRGRSTSGGYRPVATVGWEADGCRPVGVCGCDPLAGRCGLRGLAEVEVVQGADYFWERSDLARRGELDGPEVGCVLVEREVRARLM